MKWRLRHGRKDWKTAGGREELEKMMPFVLLSVADIHENVAARRMPTPITLFRTYQRAWRRDGLLVLSSTTGAALLSCAYRESAAI